MDCNKVKQGVFQILLKIPPYTKYTVQRNDSFQTVKNEITGEVEKEKVDWLDKCTYQLSSFESDSISKTLNKAKVQITAVTDKYYLIKVSDESGKISFNDTMWIVSLIGGFKSIGETYNTAQ